MGDRWALIAALAFVACGPPRTFDEGGTTDAHTDVTERADVFNYDIQYPDAADHAVDHADIADVPIDRGFADVPVDRPADHRDAPSDRRIVDGCVPTIPAGSHEDTDALCSDGIDNDCNGYADCNDFYCSRYTPSVTVCRDGGMMDATMDTGADVRDVSIDVSIDVPTNDALDGTVGDANCSAVLTINEVQTAGATSPADEFVEIYNAAMCTASLAGWELQYTSATGSPWQPIWTGQAADFITGQGYAVVAGMDFPGASIGVFASSSGALGGTGGGVGLFEPGGALIDSVGYGTGTNNAAVETSPAPTPPAAQSISRSPDGHDTNDNSVDFAVTTTPTPGAMNP